MIGKSPCFGKIKRGSKMKDKFIHDCEAMENKALTNRIAQLDQNMRNIRIAIVVIILLWFVMMAILN
jgi:hypothetical protein